MGRFCELLGLDLPSSSASRVPEFLSTRVLELQDVHATMSRRNNKSYHLISSTRQFLWSVSGTLKLLPEERESNGIEKLESTECSERKSAAAT